MRTCAHTQWYDVDYLKGVRGRTGVPRINPEDAAELGIEEEIPSVSTTTADRLPCWPSSIPVSSAAGFTARAAS